MANVALTVAETAIANTATYVSSAQAFGTRAFLASDFATNDEVRFEATGNGPIEVLNHAGARLGFVPAESSAVAIKNEAGVWSFQPAGGAPPAAFVADGSDAATTQALANALKALLVARGWMRAEAA